MEIRSDSTIASWHPVCIQDTCSTIFSFIELDDLPTLAEISLFHNSIVRSELKRRFSDYINFLQNQKDAKLNNLHGFSIRAINKEFEVLENQDWLSYKTSIQKMIALSEYVLYNLAPIHYTRELSDIWIITSKHKKALEIWRHEHQNSCCMQLKSLLELKSCYNSNEKFQSVIRQFELLGFMDKSKENDVDINFSKQNIIFFSSEQERLIISIFNDNDKEKQWKKYVIDRELDYTDVKVPSPNLSPNDFSQLPLNFFNKKDRIKTVDLIFNHIFSIIVTNSTLYNF